jgi:hypothetical protein
MIIYIILLTKVKQMRRMKEVVMMMMMGAKEYFKFMNSKTKAKTNKNQMKKMKNNLCRERKRRLKK